MQRLQQFVVPDVVADVEQHRARRVAHVGGMDLAVRQLPHQPAVDRAESQVAMGCGDVGAVHMVQDPADLGCREVRVDHQAGAVADLRFHAMCTQLRAQRFAAPVLPDDGVVDRLAGAAVPHHRGLALVGDADAGDVLRRQPGLGQHLVRGGQLAVPDLVRLVFHPARLRVDLAEFTLRHRDGMAAVVEDDAARAGGALVEREDVFLRRHGALSPATAHCTPASASRVA